MTITEHRLTIVQQIEELSEESLCELEKIITQLKTANSHSLPQKNKIGLKNLLASWSPVDDFPEIEDKPPTAENIF